MDAVGDLLGGFGSVLTPTNLALVALGALIGTLVGALPGIGPVPAMALLIPFAGTLDPIGGIILIAGVYYGAMYGSASTSILFNMPGDNATVVTCFDGYPMTKKGRAKQALAAAAYASFAAGTLSIVVLTFLAPTVVKVALKFSPVEYTSLLLFGLITAGAFVGSSILRSLTGLFIGLAVAVVGIDLQTGVARLTFGWPELFEGVPFAVVVVGLFAIAEVLNTMGEDQDRDTAGAGLRGTFRLNRQETKAVAAASGRGSVTGFLAGILPGAGATIATFLAYDLEKRVSKNPEQMGKGAIQGVAGPEAAANASVGGAMVPTLSLGIPGSASAAVLLSAFIMFGLTPGPTLFQDHGGIVWALIASMYIGNAMLLAVNMPMVGLLSRAVNVNPPVLCSVVLVLAGIGAYSLNGRAFDLFILAVFGALGFIMQRRGFPLAPVVLGLVLGGLLERNLQSSLLLSDGNFGVFLERPISAAFLALTALVLIQRPVSSGVKRLLGRRARELKQDSDRDVKDQVKL